MLGSAGKTVSVDITQPCRVQHESSHKLYANEWAWPCANKTLLRKTGGRPDLGPQWLTHTLYFHSSKYLLKQIITHNAIFRILN